MIKIIKQSGYQKIIRHIGAVALVFLSIVQTFPIVNAVSINDDEEIYEVNEAVIVSAEYDNLEAQLSVLGGMASDSDPAVIKRRQMIIEQQIILLNQEMSKLNDELSSYLKDKDILESEMEVKQAMLENEHERNIQKIKTIGENIVDSCLDASVMANGADSVINQIATMKIISENDEVTMSEIYQIGADMELVQQELMRFQKRLFTITELLEEKREFVYDYLFAKKDRLQYVEIGDLIAIPEKTITTTHVDENEIMWVDPCEYTRLASPFGYRIHPVYKEWKMHNGVDLANKSKTPIYTTRSGVVIDVGYDDSSGYHVIVDHLDEYKSCYLHLRVQSELNEGDVVVIGDYIGEMGTTGVSTGVHLHFGVSHNGEWVDPMDYIG